MDGHVKMRILGWSEKDETLFVQFNTKYIWGYKPVTKTMYDELWELNKEEREREFINMIRTKFLVGTIKEVDNDERS